MCLISSLPEKDLAACVGTWTDYERMGTDIKGPRPSYKGARLPD